ncbi:class I SAM-dependent methyltransferase [Nisaea acidiphila]|uniref:Class I SAM-dependent methyltransferase n=1 Tax=Nisaea acidiphila TaxID=1862145 RepID=A0A9J7AW52_9PROT|nr:class I SAM-dependent methyltransferase [Nisaea acidiphila]UUX49661.1 class I SAM-dependent methyltransferase [Nisaea acidiphila]
MSHDKILRTDGNVSRIGAENAESYDAWASDYDRELANWGYEAPEQAAGLLKGHLDEFEAARILDCGCGTGLTGAALREAGAGGELIGFDASRSSLETAAKKRVYDRLEYADLNEPLALEDSSVDGILCIGVLTYLEEEPIFRQWLRILRPGGVVVFTSRSDFWQSRGILATLRRLEAESLWTARHVSPPMPYLPGHPDFADKVKAIYAVCQKSAS